MTNQFPPFAAIKPHLIYASVASAIATQGATASQPILVRRRVGTKMLEGQGYTSFWSLLTLDSNFLLICLC